MDLISIITPTYKRDMTIIRRAIDSITRQTYPEFEHIICSDGPEEPIVKALVGGYGDKRIKYRATGTRLGGTGAPIRNEVMKTTNGKYHVFLDDDNILFPTYLEKMHKALTSSPESRFAICAVLHFGPITPIEEWGRPPLILEGVPELFKIDTIQVMVESEAIRSLGWIRPMELYSDGRTYEKLGKLYRWVRVPEVLAVHF